MGAGQADVETADDLVVVGDEPAQDAAAASALVTADDGDRASAADAEAGADARDAAVAPEGEAADEAPDLAALPLSGSLEAILMVADEPIPAVVLASVLRRPQPEVEGCLRSLAAAYDEAARGFDLREVAGGWRFYSRPEYAAAVEHFVLDGQQARLTQAALETLAVVAYRQPVSRARVSAIRGVNVDSVMRTLTARGLVAEAGEDPSTGAHLFRTTPYFLERLGAASLAELPELPPHLPDVEDLEAEM